MALRWLYQLLRRLVPERDQRPALPPTPSVHTSKSFEQRRILVRRHAASGDAPPLHWRACHPSTMSRFKAELTCSYGHGLTLRSHRIDASGAVFPSVVCPAAGCSFHEFVRLDDWPFGPLPKPATKEARRIASSTP